MQIETNLQKSKKGQDLQNKKKSRRRKSFSDSDSYFSAESDSDDSLASVKTIASEKNSKRKNNFNNGYMRSRDASDFEEGVFIPASTLLELLF